MSKVNPRKWQAATFLLTVSVVLFGCSNGASVDEGTTSSPEAVGGTSPEVEANPTAAAESNGDVEHEGELVLYTAVTEGEITRMVEAFNEVYPEVAVEVVRRPGGQLQELIETELQAQEFRGDVVEHSDAAQLKNLHEDYDLFASADSPEVSSYPDTLRIDDFGVPSYGILQALAYNVDAVDAGSAPATWDDFLSEEFAGRRTTVAPGAGGCAWALSLFQRQAFGVEYWERLAAAEPTILPGNTAMAEALASGENLISTMHDIVGQGVIDNGAPIEMVYPPEGAAPCYYASGIVADAAHPQAASVWIDWTLSEEGQGVWVDELGGISAREGMHLPAHLPDDAAIAEFSFDDYIDLRDTWIAEWEDIFDFR